MQKDYLQYKLFRDFIKSSLQAEFASDEKVCNIPVIGLHSLESFASTISFLH